jgi:hypothetical protein
VQTTSVIGVAPCAATGDVIIVTNGRVTAVKIPARIKLRREIAGRPTGLVARVSNRYDFSSWSSASQITFSSVGDS